MSKLSRYQLDPQVKYKIKDFLWRGLTLLADKDEVSSFFNQFFSPTEREMFAKRLYIAKMLREGHTYLTIKANLNVIDATISRVSNQLKEDSSPIIKMIDLLINEEIKREDRLLKSADTKRRPYLMESLVDAAGKEFTRRVRKSARKISAKE